nr:uncharacterized protein LOC127300477 isoform X2 [Lolium perenne]
MVPASSQHVRPARGSGGGGVAAGPPSEAQWPPLVLSLASSSSPVAPQFMLPLPPSDHPWLPAASCLSSDPSLMLFSNFRVIRYIPGLSVLPTRTAFGHQYDLGTGAAEIKLAMGQGDDLGTGSVEVKLAIGQDACWPSVMANKLARLLASYPLSRASNV